jgi:hypothetical protein
MTAGVLLVLLLPQVRERGLDVVSHACLHYCIMIAQPFWVLLQLLLLLLPQVRERGLDVVSHAGVINKSEAPHAAAALRSSSEADVERVAAHMLAQEGVSCCWHLGVRFGGCPRVTLGLGGALG